MYGKSPHIEAAFTKPDDFTLDEGIRGSWVGVGEIADAHVRFG
jgi:hypothetical protein